MCTKFGAFTALWALTYAAAAMAAPNIVLFGDSLSDDGNGYAANAKFVLRTTQTYPEEPYFLGRWSDGVTWIEVAAAILNVELTNYGAGGATTGIVPAQVPPLPVGFAGLTLPTTVLSPTLPQQLNMHFLATNNSVDPTAIYIIFIGANDYFSIVYQQTNVTAVGVVNYVEDAMQQLYDRGARKFLLPGEPALAGIPAFNQKSLYGVYPASAIDELAAQVSDHNVLIQELATTFAESHLGSQVTYFDFGAANEQVKNNASNLGITHTTVPCYLTVPDLAANSQPTAQPIGAPNGTLCSDPATYFFWDQQHLTTGVHEQIGTIFAQQYASSLFDRSSTLLAPIPAQAPTGSTIG